MFVAISYPDHVMFYNSNSNGGSFRLFNSNQVISVTSSAELLGNK